MNVFGTGCAGPVRATIGLSGSTEWPAITTGALIRRSGAPLNFFGIRSTTTGRGNRPLGGCSTVGGRITGR